MRTITAGLLILASACGGGGSGDGGADDATDAAGPGVDGAPGVPSDLCAGLIADQAAHPMTALTRPARGQAVTDAEFGTTIRRITEVSPGGGNDPVIKPLYSTVSAWNADESRLLLLSVAGGTHQLYDGRTYQHLEDLDLSPADVEQVYWHTTDPDLLFYVDDRTLIRYHVAGHRKEPVVRFDFCAGAASAGSDPMFTSFDSRWLGLRCGDQAFVVDLSTGAVGERRTTADNPPQLAPSGALAYWPETGEVSDRALRTQRRLDLREPFGHASLGRLPTGEDTWNGQVFDEGPGGNDDVGSLVTWDLTRGTSRVIIGPETGYPYPPDGHVSALAYRAPGWVVVSTFGNTDGRGLLDQEILLADTATGRVCRAGRHRSWGKDNTRLAEPYWAEPHAVPSPSGTRIVFASDWGNGATVDTYVVELPGYRP